MTGLCAALLALSSPTLRIEMAEEIAGAFAAPDGTRVDVKPACRVRGTASSGPGSAIGFELWLPREGWNGRYYQLGNGGFAGAVHYPSLAAEVARGNAVAGTDTGHRGNGFDARWARGNPVAVEDYGYRSIGTTALAARRLVQAYYGRQARFRYFVGCSNGGRQALMAAARYPAEWEGVLAGAPANPWTRQLETFSALQQALRRSPGRLIPPTKLALIQDAALRSCPPGTVSGGVALAPDLCRFRPERLACRNRAAKPCLSGTELQALRLIVRAGYQPTSAAGPDRWARWIVADAGGEPSQLTFATEAQRHLFGAPDWSADGPRPWAPAPQSVRRILDVRPSELRRFAARGGKILSYFGWADPVISPRLALDFYAAVPRALKAAGAYRLFVIPGMNHCQGGAGPTNFGQSLAAPSKADDPRYDIRRALEAWVERSRVPDRLIAVDPLTQKRRTIWALRR